jgi:hypothetical protein
MAIGAHAAEAHNNAFRIARNFRTLATSIITPICLIRFVKPEDWMVSRPNRTAIDERRRPFDEHHAFDVEILLRQGVGECDRPCGMRTNMEQTNRLC